MKTSTLRDTYIKLHIKLVGIELRYTEEVGNKENEIILCMLEMNHDQIGSILNSNFINDI